MKELLIPFLIGTFAVVLMFDANLLMYIQKSFDLAAVPPTAIAQYILFSTPKFLNMTLPVGMALAASLATSRLARESELTAMRSAGASIRRFILPILVFGIGVGALNFAVTEYLTPPAELQTAKLEQKIGTLVMAPSLAQNAYIKLDRFQVSIGQIQKVGQDHFILSDVLLFSRPKPEMDQVIASPEGEYDKGHWTFKNPVIRQIQGDSLIQLDSKQPLTINERIQVADLFAPPQPTQMSIGSLRQTISQGIKRGVNVLPLEVELQTRFSVPAACIIFAIAAPALAILYARSGGFAGVLLSIFIVFLYYNAFVVSTEILGKNPSMPPFLSAWLPNILFAAIGWIALKRLE